MTSGVCTSAYVEVAKTTSPKREVGAPSMLVHMEEEHMESVTQWVHGRMSEAVRVWPFPEYVHTQSHARAHVVQATPRCTVRHTNACRVKCHVHIHCQ